MSQDLEEDWMKFREKRLSGIMVYAPFGKLQSEGRLLQRRYKIV